MSVPWSTWRFEQAELNNLDIDTRADIYSLGVLLYELLAGSPPFTAQQLRAAAFTEMMRMIREVEPPKPSTRLSSSDQLPSIAANRQLEPKHLTTLVSGELDWIVMRCLEKERSRRYETANALAMELRHYLADEPVLAGPPSADTGSTSSQGGIERHLRRPRPLCYSCWLVSRSVRGWRCAPRTPRPKHAANGTKPPAPGSRPSPSTNSSHRICSARQPRSRTRAG